MLQNSDFLFMIFRILLDMKDAVGVYSCQGFFEKSLSDIQTCGQKTIYTPLLKVATAN